MNGELQFSIDDAIIETVNAIQPSRRREGLRRERRKHSTECCFRCCGDRQLIILLPELLHPWEKSVDYTIYDFFAVQAHQIVVNNTLL